MHAKILNSKEQKQIWMQIESQWGITRKPDGILLQNNKGKIFLMTRDFEKILDRNLKIDSAGLYVAERPNRNEMRLSVEGTQLLGNNAAKNVVELDADRARKWLKGENVSCDIATSDFQIVRHGVDYMGCGKAKNGELHNYMPKTRRILSD